jgi:hypothetical protein
MLYQKKFFQSTKINKYSKYEKYEEKGKKTLQI